MFTRKLLVAAIAATGLIGAVAHAAEDTKRTFGEYTDDTMLLGKVKSALGSDKTTEAGEINVEVNKGIVQLNGFVDTAKEKAQAETVAKGVKGVKQVENNLDRQDGERVNGPVDRRLGHHLEGQHGAGQERADQGRRHQGPDGERRRPALRLRRQPGAERRRRQGGAVGRGREVREERPSREGHLRSRR